MSNIYEVDYRGSYRTLRSPRKSGVVTGFDPVTGMPREFQGGVREVLAVGVNFFSNGGAVAGTYIASTEAIPWPFEILNAVWQEHPNSGISYFSYNLFASDFEYTGLANTSFQDRLIKMELRHQEAGITPVALQSPIGPIISAKAPHDYMLPQALGLKVFEPNKRIQVVIKYTGTPGPNSYMGFMFTVGRL